AQAIVAEARRRLAEMGGKASQLPAMIQRVTQEYELYDQQAQMSDGGHPHNYQMPNNMDAYIDEVLQMSGMKPKPTASAASTRASSDASANHPSPPRRPAEEEPEGETAVAEESSDGATPAAEGGGITASDLAAAAGAAGGTALLFHVLRGAGRTPQQAEADAPRTPVDEMIDAIDGNDGSTSRAVAVRGTTEPATVDAPGVVSGDAPDPQSRIDQAFAVDAEARKALPPQMRAIRDMSANFENTARAVAEASDPADAVRRLRELGMDLTQDQVDTIVRDFKTLKERAASVVGRAARGAARGAM
ncbi:MAG TPA: hypothetical protein VIK69_12010, partial [Methylophilaceae bacterium]